MSRVSSVVFGSVVLAVCAGSGACTVTAQTKDRFTESNYVLTDTAPWAGETINVNIAGVGLAVDGGVKVISDPTFTTITANARMLAMANTDDKASADQSIADAKATFVISRATAGEIDINCGHGGSHGSSDAGSSGCELVEIHVPGSTTQKLNMPNVLSGNGTLTLTLGNANLGNLGANANGAACDIVTTLPATQGATVSLVSNQAGDITATLPTAFAADKVDFEADPGAVNVGPFADITTFNGTTGRGAAGTGFASLKLTSVQFAGSSGKITLVAD